MVAAPVERHAAGLIAEVSTALAPGVTAEEGIRRFVRSGIGAHRIALDLHKVLTEQVPRVGRIATAIDTSRLVTEMLAGFLQARRDDLSVGCDITTAAIIILLRRNRKMVGTPLNLVPSRDDEIDPIESLPLTREKTPSASPYRLLASAPPQRKS